MKKIIASGVPLLLVARVLRFAVGSVPDGQWQNYRVFSERQPGQYQP